MKNFSDFGAHGRRRTKHRRYRGYDLVDVPGLGLVDVPGLSDLSGYFPKVLGEKVNSTDVLVGAGLGMAASGALTWLANMLFAPKPGGDLATEQNKVKMLGWAKKAMPLVGSFLSGTVLFAVQQKASPERAQGHAIGAMAAGVGLTTWDLLKAQFSAQLGDYSLVQIPGYSAAPSIPYYGYGDVFVNEPLVPKGYGDVYVDERAGVPLPPGQMAQYDDLPQLADACRIAMGDGDMSDVEQLMQMG